MDCQRFLSSYTDFRDGLLPDAEAARLEGHLSECASCRRYDEVVEEGVRQLRQLPPIRTGDDFVPRLRHRIYHLEDGDALTPTSAGRGSGVTAVAAVGIAVLLTAAAWSPVLRQAGEGVRLSPIIVSGPPPSASDVGIRASAFFRATEAPRSSGSGWSPPMTFWTAADEGAAASPGFAVASPPAWGGEFEADLSSVTLSPPTSGDRSLVFDGQTRLETIGLGLD